MNIQNKFGQDKVDIVLSIFSRLTFAFLFIYSYYMEMWFIGATAAMFWGSFTLGLNLRRAYQLLRGQKVDES